MIVLRNKMFINTNIPQPSPNPSSVVVAPNKNSGKKNGGVKPAVANAQQTAKQQISLQTANLRNNNEQMRAQRAVLESQDNMKKMALRKQENTQRRERDMKDRAIKIRKLEMEAAKLKQM